MLHESLAVEDRHVKITRVDTFMKQATYDQTSSDKEWFTRRFIARTRENYECRYICSINSRFHWYSTLELIRSLRKCWTGGNYRWWRQARGHMDDWTLVRRSMPSTRTLLLLLQLAILNPWNKQNKHFNYAHRHFKYLTEKLSSKFYMYIRDTGRKCRSWKKWWLTYK